MSNGRYRFEQGGSRAKRLSSMPSGHSAGLAAVARAAGRDYPNAAVPAAGAAATVIAAQLPAKNHFVSDLRRHDDRPSRRQPFRRNVAAGRSAQRIRWSSTRSVFP